MVPVAPSARVSPARYTASWPYKGAPPRTKPTTAVSTTAHGWAFATLMLTSASRHSACSRASSA
eukprot:5057711-Pyramimonas_sp.AAC.1